MEGTGICTVCGAEDVALDSEEKCQDCKATDSKPDEDMDAPPEGSVADEDQM
jgi:hypothetical protein